MRRKIAMRSQVVREHPAEVKSQGLSPNRSYAIVHIEPHLSFRRVIHYQRGEEAALSHKRHIAPQGPHGRSGMKAVMTMMTLLYSRRSQQ